MEEELIEKVNTWKTSDAWHHKYSLQVHEVFAVSCNLLGACDVYREGSMEYKDKVVLREADRPVGRGVDEKVNTWKTSDAWHYKCGYRHIKYLLCL